jgi:Haloacid dehalogenase-like hydrolase
VFLGLRRGVRTIADRFELVIFDCDGVLVDSEPIINQAHAHVLAACGYPVTEEELVERFCGMSDPEMLEIIQREWGRALPTSYAERVGLMIEVGFRQSLAPIEGVAEALDSLTLPICVASSSSLEQIRQKTEDNRPSETFWRTPVQRDDGCTRQARARPVSICRAAPYDGAGPLSRRRGQSCRDRCRTRRRDTSNLPARSEPIDAGVRHRLPERAAGMLDRRRRLRRPPPFPVYGRASSKRSTRNGDRSRS